ncbi:CAAX amino terminal protease family [Streptococcus sp. DD11]|uniref:CPBP family intramembrane glutamic endopeptidase n=1 Tax=Streptococcus sp. DD11 TaxID=1777879 RepID=UPI00079B58D8|nr:CPBP family intramembrane glutamic endopeptidase [Streptococcus sp. DD11]KXT85485.1 CAAX amino terminal protease family [Streptococcus sp. DD11]
MNTKFFSKNNPLVAGVRQGKFLTPWFLAPFILHLILKLMGPVRTASTHFFLGFNLGIPDWWNILDLFSFSYTILVFFIWVKFVERRPIQSMGFPKKSSLSEFAKGVLVGAVMISSVLLIFLLLGAAKLDRIQFSGPFLISWLLVLIGYIIQTSAEEIYIRGWLLPVISNKTNLFVALLISSAMFSYYHLDNNGASVLSTIHLVIFGLFAAVYALKRGSLWGPCGFHFAWNFLQGNLYGFHVSGFDSESSLMYFSTSDNTLITGGKFGPEGGLPGLLILSLALLWAIFILKSREEDESLDAAA